MSKNNLTRDQALERLNYCPDTGVFRWTESRQRPGEVAGSCSKRGYWMLDFNGVKYFAHRVAWLCVHGAWPVGDIDHINGCKTDNRIGNLRDVSRSVNMQNMRGATKRSKSKLLGTSFKPRHGWHASIRVDGKNRHLGYFASAELAHAAYLEAKRGIHEGCTI